MDRDFSIGGREFKLSKLDAFKQFHIARRIGPMLADLFPAMKAAKSLTDQAGLSEDQKLDAVAKIAAPVMNGLAKLSDADSEIVLFGLLQAVEMKQLPAGNWARVSSNSMLMIQDLELPILMQLAGRSFMFNIAGFFNALPQK